MNKPAGADWLQNRTIISDFELVPSGGYVIYDVRICRVR